MISFISFYVDDVFFGSGVVVVMSNDVSPKSRPKHFDFIFLWLIIPMTIDITDTITASIDNTLFESI